jgi:hypothetical protein
VERRHLTSPPSGGWRLRHLVPLACTAWLAGVAPAVAQPALDAGVVTAEATATPTPPDPTPESLRAEPSIASPDPRRGVWDLEPIVTEPPPYV